MRVFTTTELERMQGTQDGAMMDSCIVLTYQDGAVDVYGMPKEEYVEGASLMCGLDPAPEEEAMGEAQENVGEAKLRLPIGTLLERTDRVQITHRHGVLLEEQPVYELVGEARRGPSGLVWELKLATMESVRPG